MNIFQILKDRSKLFYFYLAFLGMTNAIWNGGLLLVISYTVNKTPIPYFEDKAWIPFVLLIVISFVVGKYFQVYMLKLTINLSYELGMTIFEKLRCMNYSEFETFGKEKVHTLMRDSQTVSDFPGGFIETFNAFVTALIGLIYLFTISILGSLAILVVLIVLIVIYRKRASIAYKYMEETRQLADEYHKNINDFSLGFKELKMNSQKSQKLFYSYLDKNRVTVKGLNLRTSITWVNNDLFAQYSWYVIIGSVLFLLPLLLSIEMASITVFLVTLLFIMGPINTLVSAIPQFSRINLAVERLIAFDRKVKKISDENVLSPTEVLETGFSNISFRDVYFEYQGKEGEATFSVQIDRLDIKKGELVFVTGGNGSGKSTFINLLVGLIRPQNGEILFNDKIVEPENYQEYRDRISPIFSDNYLFTENYGDYAISKDNQALNNYIEFMQLKDIVEIDEDENKLKIELSRGQRKRLAMINLLMEDKDILVLDEWAADQDPEFRGYFYKIILPKLKGLGKTIIVVTHDDMYFNEAERIIKFDFGRIISDEKKVPTFN